MDAARYAFVEDELVKALARIADARDRALWEMRDALLLIAARALRAAEDVEREIRQTEEQRDRHRADARGFAVPAAVEVLSEALVRTGEVA